MKTITIIVVAWYVLLSSLLTLTNAAEDNFQSAVTEALATDCSDSDIEIAFEHHGYNIYEWYLEPSMFQKIKALIK